VVAGTAFVPTELSRLPGLAAMVEEKLEQRWSPQQIFGWLEA
jgi:IS30 family transposase